MSIATSPGPSGASPSFSATPEMPLGPGPRNAERGCALRLDRVAVLVEHLREAVQRRLDDRRRRRPPRSSSASEAGIGSRTAWMLSTVSADRTSRSTFSVSSREQVVERRAQAVGEHERAGHERDAEHDRQPDEHVAAPTGAHRLTCDLADHRQWPICFIWSMTRSTVGSRISATIWPSARNTIAVGVGRRGRVVRDHHDRLAELVDGASHERQELAAGRAVEVAGRLVGEDDRRPAGERAGDGDALLLTARQLARPVRQPVARAPPCRSRGRSTPCHPSCRRA